MRTSGRCLSSLLLLNVAAHICAQSVWAGGTPPPFNQGFAPAPAPVASPIDQSNTAVLAGEIIAGEVLGFLNETHPTPQELTCIKFGSSEVAKMAVATSSHLVDLLQTVFGHGGRRLLPPGEEGGGTAQIIPDVKQSMVDVMNMVKGRTFDCLQAEGINDFKRAAAHLGDLHFMEQSLLANGAEVSYELTSAIKAWKGEKYGLFGGFLGQAWRRILLGGPQQGGMVPPPDFAIQQMTNGMLQGFFGSGFFMRLGVTTSTGAIQDMQISLHNCIAENLMFFRSAWGAVAGLLSGLRDEVHGKQLTLAEQKARGRKEQAAIAQSLISLPGALSRCSSSTGQRLQLGQVLEAFEDGRMSLELPQRSTEAIDLSVDLTAALQNWDQHDFAGFGFRLGRLLQRVALLAFPQKYAVDESGSLKCLLGEFSGKTSTTASFMSLAPTLGAAALLVSVAAAAIWTRHQKATGARSATRLPQQESLQESFSRLPQQELERLDVGLEAGASAIE